jgi:uridine phosphorylase
MAEAADCPLLHHPIDEAPVFTAASLMADVRRTRNLPHALPPAICVLDFDGDLTDSLVAQGVANPYPAWPCFHTTMFQLELEGMTCGIIPRTIGGPYSVLIAEQLAVAGVTLILGLTSAGRVSPYLALPSLVVATSAIRDEGTSLHYLPPGREVACPTAITDLLYEELTRTRRPVVRGKVWTTDAPYRETRTQLQTWASQGVLAVEMQAASLFAFGQATGANVAVVAMVSNAVDHTGEQFDTGTTEDGLAILRACARATRGFTSIHGT